jgi:long-chain fatty acid transport protein
MNPVNDGWMMTSSTGAKISRLFLAVASGLAAASASAAGFALLEQSGSGLGRAFAGTASTAEDASAIFYNPAAMALLKEAQLSAVASGINLHSQFSDRGSQAALGQPPGGSGGNAGDLGIVPAAYAAAPLSDQLVIGIGINAPFGLKTDYDRDWLGRFQALKSEIKTYNFNPSLAYRCNERFVIGVGADYQRLLAELGSAVNYTAAIGQGVQQLALAGLIPAAAVPGLIGANAGLAGRTRVRGDDAVWGFNVGLLFDLTPGTRLGLAYRSKMKYDVGGSVRFEAPTATNPVGAGILSQAETPGGPLANGPVKLHIALPDSAVVSLSQKLNEAVDLSAEVAWTGWSSIQELRIIRPSGAVLSLTPETWRDTWRYALGLVYAVDPQWKVRTGIAYDRTPVPDATRTPRLPDTSRKWVAIGGGWSPLPAVTVDAGYAHLFARDVPLNQSEGNPPAYGLIFGEQASRIDIFSLQATVKF